MKKYLVFWAYTWFNLILCWHAHVFSGKPWYAADNLFDEVDMREDFFPVRKEDFEITLLYWRGYFQ